MNLNDLLNPKAFIIYALLSFVPLFCGVYSIWVFVTLFIFLSLAYLTNFPAKNTIFEKNNMTFPFYGNLVDSKINEDQDRVTFCYQIPFWKLRSTIAFPTYSELIIFEKEVSKKTSYVLKFNSNFGMIEVKAYGSFYSEMRLSKVGDFGLGNRKVLKIWGPGKVYLTLPQPISDSFAISSYRKARRGIRLNSFKV